MSSTNAPVVSVIMPVYNSMPYLEATLRSLTAQSLSVDELEIIAIDDGSTDGSGELLDDVASRFDNVKVIHQPNSGWPGMPRNKGLDIARGDYVFFMDSDDELAPDALRQLCDMAQQNGSGVVFPRMQGTGGRDVQRFYHERKAGKLPVSIALHSLSPQKLFLRSFIEGLSLRFAEGMVRLEDGIFVTHAYLNATRIDLCGDDPLYFIAERDDGNNISARSINPVGYVQSLRTIARDIQQHVTSESQATRLITELFGRKGLRFYAPFRWMRLDTAIQQEWITEHQRFLAEFVKPGAENVLNQPTHRQLVKCLREADVAGVNALVNARALLQHESAVVETLKRGSALEIVVSVKWQPDEQHAQPGVSFDSMIALPDEHRLERALRASRTFVRLSGFAWARALGRKLENVIIGTASPIEIVVEQRSSGKRIHLQGRWVSVGDEMQFRCVIASRFARNQQTLDVWTLPQTREGQFGLLSRSRWAQTLRPVNWLGGKSYATNKGNFSIRF